MAGLEHIARIEACKKSAYGHFFGGPALHQAARFKGARSPLHLVYCFNLADPALGAIKHVEGLTSFPLYHGFQFDGCRFGYLVEADDRLTIFSGPQKFVADFPYEGYPEVFPKTPVRAQPIAYEDQKCLTLAHADAGGADDNLERLSASDQRRLRSLGYPFTQIGGPQPLMQGSPNSRCPNPACWAHSHNQPMHVIATVWDEPVPGVNLWIEEGGDYVELVYEQCSICSAIYVTNQCD